jgi:hypothetical protein
MAPRQHIRPYPLENTGSRPLSHSQASEGRISSWVGDDQRIPAVVCFLAVISFLHSFAITVLGSSFIHEGRETNRPAMNH